MQHAGSMTLKTIAPLSEDPIVKLPPWRAGNTGQTRGQRKKRHDS
jgi:hypothetical protein